jgi:hypothetical protein
MPAKANLSIVDQRRVARRRIDVTLLGEHRVRGDIRLKLVNISTDGFMVADTDMMDRGDRLMIRLPVVGYIEAFCLWVSDSRAGFQFERPIRANEFHEMLATMERRDSVNRSSVGKVEEACRA